jgi:protein TonB
MNSQATFPERRRDLTYAALFTLVLIAGVAWWGDLTHFRLVHRTPDRPPTQIPFTIPLDPPPPVDVTDNPPKPQNQDIAPPSIPDSPAKPMVNDFIEPIEPPRPNISVRMDKIPSSWGPGDIGAHAFDPSQLDQAAVAVYQARPIYPDIMKREGISGEATVDFIVDPEGRVRNARPAHSSQREFEEPACNAVSKWKFRPGRKGGRAVYVHMQVPVVFTLSDEGGP